MKIYTSEEFINMLDLSIDDDDNYNFDFNDEIVNIEEIDDIDMYDIDVTGNHLYYSNDILTHNSAVGTTDANNDSVSDSLGTVMTADFIVFLLQTEQMKEENLISCKVTKNRFNGRTDQWNMEIDYNKMRFSDTLVDTTLSKETEVELDNIIEEQRKNDMKIVKEHDMKDDFDIMSELGL